MFELMFAVGFESWGYFALVSVYAFIHSVGCVLGGYVSREPK